MTVEVIDVAGDAYQRGREFGTRRRGQIEAYISDWLASLSAARIVEPFTYVKQMLGDTDFLTSVSTYAPDLLEEIRGTAAGSGLSFELLFGSQCMDEEWAYRRGRLKQAEGVHKCSSVAIKSKNGLTWVGQNMDLGRFTDGHQLALRIRAHLPEQGALVFSIGGMIGLMGVNTRGVAVCVNSLPQLPAVSEGLPVAFVVRKLLQSETAEDADLIVRSVPHATGQHYLIADRTSIRSFEASAVGVVQYHSPDPDRIFHTNHPLVTEATPVASPEPAANTVARLRALNSRLGSSEPSLAAIKAALSSSDDPINPICRSDCSSAQFGAVTGLATFTTGSMISQLRQGDRSVEAWMSAGPPCLRGYHRFECE